jgi:inosose dehydratase
MLNRLGVTTGCYQRYTLSEALAGIAEAGYHFVELAAIPGVVEHVPLNADVKTLGHVQRLLHRLDLIPISLSAHSDLTTPVGQQTARQGLDLCERLGIEVMNTAVGGAFNEQEDEAAFMAGIHPLADYAAERQVVIGIEIHGTLTGTGQKTRVLLERVNHPNVRINYDTANAEYFAGVRAEADLPEALPLIAHCHLKDKIGGDHVWNFPALGEGHVDFRHLLTLFETSGYAGPFSVEVEFHSGAEPSLTDIQHALKQSRDYLAPLGLA